MIGSNVRQNQSENLSIAGPCHTAFFCGLSYLISAKCSSGAKASLSASRYFATS